MLWPGSRKGDALKNQPIELLHLYWSKIVVKYSKLVFNPAVWVQFLKHKLAFQV